MGRRKKAQDLPEGWEKELVLYKPLGKIEKLDEDKVYISFSKGNVELRFSPIREDWLELCEIPDELDDEVDAIYKKVISDLSELRKEMNIHHYVQFEDGSPCYFDYLSNVLIGAQGKKGYGKKLKEIRGKPENFESQELAILEALIRARDYRIGWGELIVKATYGSEDSDAQDEIYDNSLKSRLTSQISKIKNYDSSLENTIKKESKNGELGYKYIGNPDYWVIGNVKPGENDEDYGFTLRTVFTMMESLNILVPDSRRESFRVTAIENAEAVDRFTFLVPPGFLDMTEHPVECEDLYRKNRLDSEILLSGIYKKGAIPEIMHSVWDYLKAWISNNYEASLSAVIYCALECEHLPAYEDLENVPPNRKKRMIQSINVEVCSILEGSKVAEVFFRDSNIDPEKETKKGTDVFDYITAMVLASFWYCSGPDTAELNAAKRHYRLNLISEIEKRFSPNLQPLSSDNEQDFYFTEKMTRKCYEMMQAYERAYNQKYGDGAFEARNKYSNENDNNPNGKDPSPTLTR